jgi:large subunit ribosomal protein L17
MVRNTVVNLLRYERIRTTVKKAKLVRPYVEKMITLGKRGTLHARRQALAFLRSKPAVAKLFRTLGPRFAERPGGYVRIIKLAEAMRPARSDRIAEFEPPAGVRLGDGTPLAILELVEADFQPRQGMRRRSVPEPFRPRREDFRKSAAGGAGSATPESAAAEPVAAEPTAAEPDEAPASGSSEEKDGAGGDEPQPQPESSEAEGGSEG